MHHPTLSVDDLFWSQVILIILGYNCFPQLLGRNSSTFGNIRRNYRNSNTWVIQNWGNVTLWWNRWNLHLTTRTLRSQNIVLLPFSELIFLKIPTSEQAVLSSQLLFIFLMSGTSCKSPSETSFF